MCDGDQVSRPLPGGLPFHIDYAVFGGQVVYLASGGCDNVAVKLRENAGMESSLLVLVGGAHADKGLSAFGC